MSPHWLKFLETFGNPKSNSEPSFSVQQMEAFVSSPAGRQRYDVLFQLYGPRHGSPWELYHCPTLFAAIDRQALTPKERPSLPLYEQDAPQDAFQWLSSDTMVIVDLPNGQCIEFAVRLIEEAAQPICTFDHWPGGQMKIGRYLHVAIKAQQLIDTLFTLAPQVFKARKNHPPTVAPVWICDRRRLGLTASETPGTYFNHYYIDDSLLPDIHTLKQQHISRIVYVRQKAGQGVEHDLTHLLADAHEAGIQLFSIDAQTPETWVNPTPLKAPFRRQLPLHRFKALRQGGFGRIIPSQEYSSSGYSSSRRGG